MASGGNKTSLSPVKKNDFQLYQLIEKCIKDGSYIFLPHSNQRLLERRILDIVVLDILEGVQGTQRCRNKKKDIFLRGQKDWNYCIEGLDSNLKAIRIILSFSEKQMLIITVMWVNKR